MPWSRNASTGKSRALAGRNSERTAKASEYSSSRRLDGEPPEVQPGLCPDIRERSLFFECSSVLDDGAVAVSEKCEAMSLLQTSPSHLHSLRKLREHQVEELDRCATQARFVHLLKVSRSYPKILSLRVG